MSNRITATAMQLAWDSETQSRKGYVRPRSDDPYHSYRWTRLSRRWRAEHPVCAECLKSGRYVAAEVVDHIVPWPVCGDFFDEKNLQSLCGPCNIAKGNRDKKLIQEWHRNNPQSK